MFKKKPTIKPLANLKSSDRRRLADQIIQDLELDLPIPSDDQTPEQKADATLARTNLRNALLPDNVQSARFTTTHGPELKQASGTLYVGNQDGQEARVLWFQIEGRIYPSVYTLWRNSDIVPLLHTHEFVMQKLQGGADLMTPGLAAGPPFPAKAKKGVIVGIASTERPTVPMAVGVCEIDVSLQGRVQGVKGHAVENFHWCGDELWSYGLKSSGGQQPPEEIAGWAKVLEDRGLTDKVDALGLEDQQDDGGVALQNGGQSAVDGDINVPVDADTTNGDENTAPLTQDEIDNAFRQAFLYGVHSHISSNPNTTNHGLVFPLSQSVTISSLVQPFLPAFTPEQSQQLQIKKTSFKTIKKFIKSLDKAKILKSKDKDSSEVVIMDIDFEDAAIVNFKPYRLPKKETAGGSASGRDTDKPDTGDDAVGQKLQVVSYFRPTTKLQPLFDALPGSKSLYTPPEVRELVTTYLESENLISESNKRLSKLNPTLANSVFDGSGPLDKEVLAKGTVPRDALIDRVLHAMASSYAITRNGADCKPKSGTPPKIHITLETRSGNKTVTKVSGLEVYFVNARLLADELRKTCAGSTSVEPLAGAAKKNEREVLEVMVQGPQKDAVVKALERRGVDRKWVEVLDKTKGKKR